jgi:hypothetical protein
VRVGLILSVSLVVGALLAGCSSDATDGAAVVSNVYGGPAEYSAAERACIDGSPSLSKSIGSFNSFESYASVLKGEGGREIASEALTCFEGRLRSVMSGAESYRSECMQDQYIAYLRGRIAVGLVINNDGVQSRQKFKAACRESVIGT